MKRRFLSLLTIICLVFSLTGMDCHAAALKISNQNTPASTFTYGRTFSIYGTITSTNYIKNVEVGVWNSSGTRETGTKVNCNTKSYNVHNLDNYVLFDKLTEGTKTYKIIAQDTASRVTLVNYSFKVINPNSLTISNYNTPATTINKGQTFSIKGTVSTTNTLKSVTVGVYNSAGSLETGKTATVSSKSYDIKALDNYVLFDKLTAGNKTYKIIAADQNGSKTLVSKSFTVVQPTYTFPVPGYKYGSCQLNCTCSVHNGSHNGVDISAPGGTKIVAAHSGTVKIVSTCNQNYGKSSKCTCGCGGMGNCISITNGNVVTYYMHMSGFSVSDGATVTAGQQIGTVGTTGWSTGNHLHFGLKIDGSYVNPPNYVPN